jgi:hypothetical protein
MTLRLGQLLYTSFPKVGFHIVTSPEVPAEARQAFVQKVTHQLWDAYNPPDNGYRAVYIYQEALDWTLFAWLYNDGTDDRGRSHVPYFVGHYLAGPLSPEQLDNIFALLRKGPSMAIVRQAPPEYLEEAVAPDLWDYKPVRAGVAVPAKICKQAYKALAEGKCVEIFVSGNDNDEEYGSDAHTSLSNLSSSLMIRDIDQEPGVFANDPKGELLWEKSISPAFILGILFTGVTCGLLGYSLQPKQSLVQEIITKAEVPNSIPAPDSNRIKKDLPNSQPAMDKSKSLPEIAVANNSLPPSQKTTARNNPKTSSTVSGKGTPNLSSPAKPSSALPRSPQASTTEQLPARVRSLPGKPTLAPVPRKPNLLSPSPASSQSFASAKPTDQPPTQKSVPKTSNPAEALANDGEADKLIGQKSSQAPEVEPRKQGNATPAAIPIRLIPISSTEKTLESIEIPMQDGTSVPANKLLHLDTVAWKLDKGKTRKKLVVLVNELMESKNLNSACKKANVSLDSLRLLIKKYGNA